MRADLELHNKTRYDSRLLRSIFTWCVKDRRDDPRRRTDRIRNLLSFRIESRFICYTKGNPEEPMGDWRQDAGCYTFPSAASVYRELKELRRKDQEEVEQEIKDVGHIYLGRYEYRVVPVRSRS
jgi:hypothetical protein